MSTRRGSKRQRVPVGVLAVLAAGSLLVVSGLRAAPAVPQALSDPTMERAESPDPPEAEEAPELEADAEKRRTAVAEKNRSTPIGAAGNGTTGTGANKGAATHAADGSGPGDAGEKSGGQLDHRTASGRAGSPKPQPRKVALPSQGVYKASEIARLAGEVADCPVEIADTGVETRRIEVIPLLAAQQVTLDELRLLLVFHGIYLFDSVDPDEGRVLVASTDPHWHPRQARYSRVVEVSALAFKRVWARLKAAIDRHNAAVDSRRAGAGQVAGVPVESVGKIFLRAPNRKTLKKLVQLVRSVEGERPPDDLMKLFAYVGRFHHVRFLEKEVLERLSEGERVRSRFVVMRTGNRLLYRAPARLGERITDLLKKLDRRRE